MKWISVKDRLPKQDSEVLTFHQISPLHPFTVARMYGNKWFIETNDEMIDPDYWMPLPKSPKIKDSNEL
jgi:hypothetical protein